MEIVREDIGNFKRPPRVASRVVLNNMTFSVFADTNFDTILFSSELKSLVIKSYDDD